MFLVALVGIVSSWKELNGHWQGEQISGSCISYRGMSMRAIRREGVATAPTRVAVCGLGHTYGTEGLMGVLWEASQRRTVWR